MLTVKEENHKETTKIEHRCMKIYHKTGHAIIFEHEKSQYKSR